MRDRRLGRGVAAIVCCLLIIGCVLAWPSLAAKWYIYSGQRNLTNTEYAISAFRQAVRWNPKSAEAHGELAMRLERAHRNREAIEEYETALRLDPTNTMFRMSFATLLRRSDEDERALYEEQQAAHWDPASAPVHLALAYGLLSAGRTQEARRECKRVIELDTGRWRADAERILKSLH